MATFAQVAVEAKSIDFDRLFLWSRFRCCSLALSSTLGETRTLALRRAERRLERVLRLRLRLG